MSDTCTVCGKQITSGLPMIYRGVGVCGGACYKKLKEKK